MTVSTTGVAAIRLRCPRCHAGLEPPANAQIECAGCHTVFPVVDGIPSLTPESGRDELVGYFREVAAQYDDSKLTYLPSSDRDLEYHLHVLARAVAKALRRWVPADTVVLDVGCGHGGMLGPVLDRYRFVGVDVVPELLVRARARGYTVYHGDAGNLPFADDQFDTVVSTEVLNQYPDPAGLSRELIRVCRPGGRVIVSTGNKNSLLRALRRTLTGVSTRLPENVPMVLRTAADVADLARASGAHVEEVAWVLSPAPAVVFTPGFPTPVDPFATNFILCLRKTADRVATG